MQNIFYSLIQKYDAVSGEPPIFSEKIMEDISKYVEISRYDLRSTRVHLEGAKIPSFFGTLSMHSYGPLLFRNLLHMLVSFGEYSGIGIKAAMGICANCAAGEGFRIQC
ncbi:MAG: CRISPR system precrRNA processing endoribonuclease RAMP protein Cas6 [Emergencia sp.]|uniref:CRISPR system precrRNA processing endoribonuclease RAMP protein Cas6 n=1 Tax=unclassified Emergencia TaxID=2642996 RepID=UPI00137AC727|nr:CRISPR system precrRNA processing endoribonuclease RAMP protein Cas6 [Emergencia sp.]NCE99090.1 CRISPR system precrRNA processing endoribonuclease RAMP protein Cas6 [Emergencia sp. 1XD21-10]